MRLQAHRSATLINYYIYMVFKAVASPVTVAIMEPNSS